jgi:hypothetical protein
MKECSMHAAFHGRPRLDCWCPGSTAGHSSRFASVRQPESACASLVCAASASREAAHYHSSRRCWPACRLLEWQDSLTPEQLVGKVAEGISKQVGASAASSSAPEPSGGSTAAGASTKGQVPTSVAAGQAQQQQQQAEQEQESEPEPEQEQEQEQVAADAQQAQQRSRREELAAGGGQQLLTLAASAGSLPAAQLADLVWALANTGTDDALAWWKVISAAAQQVCARVLLRCLCSS